MEGEVQAGRPTQQPTAVDGESAGISAAGWRYKRVSRRLGTFPPIDHRLHLFLSPGPSRTDLVWTALGRLVAFSSQKQKQQQQQTLGCNVMCVYGGRMCVCVRGGGGGARAAAEGPGECLMLRTARVCDAISIPRSWAVRWTFSALLVSS